MPNFYNATQAAEHFGVTKRTIQRWCDEGRFPNAAKVDPSYTKSPWVIPVEDVQALAEKFQAEFEAEDAEDRKAVGNDD